MSSLFLQIHILVATTIVRSVNLNVTKYIETFSNELQALMCDDVRVGGDKCGNKLYGVQDFIHSFQPYFDSGTEDASILANTVIDRLNSKLNLRASFLQNMSNMLQSKCSLHAYENADTETLLPFDHLFFAGNDDRDALLPDDMEFVELYQNNVSFSASTYKIPNDVKHSNANVQKDARISELLDFPIIDMYDTHCKDDSGNDEYCNMYFGTINGVFRQYPGVQSSKDSDGEYNSYDPRFRPWYVSAASGGKDVVILVDHSGSMGDNNRMSLAKKAIKSVLRTMGDSTFVSVVAFDDSIKLSCFGSKLVPATKRNVAELIDFVDGLYADGGTDFKKAFRKAFEILNKKENIVNCHTSILFLTDGAGGNPSKIIKQKNSADINAVIFSYTLGSGANKNIPRKVARMTNGIFTHIKDGDSNLVTKMSSYYLYYTYGIPETNTIVTSPYLDFDTGVVMVTMAQSVYINNTYFVGVVGTDIPLSVLSDAIGDITIGRKSYSFVMNQESELLLHPLIPNAFELFDDDGYKPILVTEIEGDEFNQSVLHLMLDRQTGAMSFDTAVKQPAGNVKYNGYIHENAHLLYIYSAVGPSSLSIAIVVYSEDGTSSTYVPSFGLKGSLNVTNCDNGTNVDPADVYECLAPFNVYHRLDLMLDCESSWSDKAQILNGSEMSETDEFYNAFFSETVYSVKYPTYYLQSGLFEEQYDALNVDPTCEELEQLHKFSNRLESVSSDDLPFAGIRDEIKANIVNSVYSLTSLHEFWKDAFLADGSSFVSIFFGHYQGLHISYPGKKFSNTYNPIIRPWYQRAQSYPNLFAWLTPYKHAVTGKLVTGASTVIQSPYSEYPFGVIGFNYEYTEFVQYWQDAMEAICDADNYCFLIDSSAFLLYFEGMEYDLDDADISRKFLGDLEPTLFQSLLDRKFFVNDTNINWIVDTIDISYIVDEDVYDSGDFDEDETSFIGNSGTYTVHAISNTNLYLIYVENYQVTGTYPQGCPYNDVCSGVRSPGCLTEAKIEKIFLYQHTAPSSTCETPIVDVCTEPETLISLEKDIELGCMSSISDFGICVLKQNQQSDICATDFVQKECDGCIVPFHVFCAFFVACVSVFFL